MCFLVSAFRGPLFSEDSCAALALFSHYFHLSQFFWMLIQAVNFWQVLVMNDEHTERRYLLYFLLGWGLPALVIIVQVVVLLGGYGWSIHSVYGLVRGDVCFIPNIYAALSTAVLVPLICVVTVLVVFIHAYQVTQQWKAYDDVYRGRTNSSADRSGWRQQNLLQTIPGCMRRGDGLSRSPVKVIHTQQEVKLTHSHQKGNTLGAAS
ncbi:G-protein coupled receptor 98 [Takifugu flavidus]|uniref:G-protein coupled receptor 98 n=1 Tax=Takifugu flavidus TaxID=433684 RepID=A0A5C6MY63_9TELE|nr:G-protein coupled receptor 98 [Takifugu flavidus]